MPHDKFVKEMFAKFMPIQWVNLFSLQKNEI